MKIYIDLLPEARKESLRRKKLFWFILKQEVIFLLPMLILLVVLYNIGFLLELQLNGAKNVVPTQGSVEKYQALKKYEEEFRSANAKIEKIQKIANFQLNWSKMLERLSSATTGGIKISEVATKDYAVFLRGNARSRDDLLALKDSLDRSGCFMEAQIPLSNLVTKENIDFQVDLKVKPECLK